jgi:hypothetical protein
MSIELILKLKSVIRKEGADYNGVSWYLWPYSLLLYSFMLRCDCCLLEVPYCHCYVLRVGRYISKPEFFSCY